jgi:hypothetical protein
VRRPGGGLGVVFDDLVSGGGAVAFDGQHRPVQVDVGPPQSAQFAAAQPPQASEPPEREQGVIGDGAEELGQVIGGPDRHGRVGARLFPGGDALLGPDLGVRRLVALDLDVPGRVAVQHAFFDSEVEGGALGGAEVLHRRGGLRPAFAVGGAGDPGEHGAQHAGVEVGQAVAAEARDEDDVDVAGVVEPGGRPDAGAGVEPVSQPSFDGPALGGAVGGGAGQPGVAGLPGGGLGWVAAAAGAFAAAEQVGGRAVEVPGAVTAVGQPRTALFETLPEGVAAAAPFEDHTVVRPHDRYLPPVSACGQHRRDR